LLQTHCKRLGKGWGCERKKKPAGREGKDVWWTVAKKKTWDIGKVQIS